LIILFCNFKTPTKVCFRTTNKQTRKA